MYKTDIKEINKKAVTSMAAFIGGALLLAGCGTKTVSVVSDSVQAENTQASEVQTESTQAENAQKAKSVEDIYQEITQEVALASPLLMEEEFITNYYGIDSAKLEEYVFSMSEDAAQAETVIVIKAHDTTDLEELAGCLQVVVDEKKNEMENYLPEQFAIVEKSEVKTRGNYVWLVISEQADAILDIIEKNITD